MSVTVKNPVVQQGFVKMKKPPVQPCLNAIKSELVKDTVQRGWSRFKSGIETKQDSDTKGRVFVNDNITQPGIQSSGLSASFAPSTATNRQIGGYLHYGTRDHGPVNAKVLSWVSGGTRVYAKRVKGITATNWWGINSKIKEKVKEVLTKWIKSFGK